MTPSNAPERDTDEDWREIGGSQPYWGVITDPKFRIENLDPLALEEFYALGRHQAAAIAAELERFTGAPVHVGSVLEFGCGVGRVSEGLTVYADEVVGYDVSPGMLDTARARGGGVAYTDILPERLFDWINAYIVFQHIPPARGLDLLRELMGRLAPDGLVSLHFTTWRDAGLYPPPPTWRQRLRPLAEAIGVIHMFDYDLGAVMQVLETSGVGRVTLLATNHAGHHGVMIFGQRSALACPF